MDSTMLPCRDCKLKRKFSGIVAAKPFSKVVRAREDENMDVYAYVEYSSPCIIALLENST